MTANNQIATVETLAANALSSHKIEHYDGWRLRYNHEVTRRANSVLAEKQGIKPLTQKLEYAEAWYRTLGVKARFQLCPASQPSKLADTLIARGYRVHDGAKVQVAKLKHVVTQATKPDITLVSSSSLNADWLSIYEQTENAPLDKAEVRKTMLECLQPKAKFMLAYLGSEVAAVGLGVYESGYVGVFNMATLPNMRKQGAATALLLGLARWGETEGAEHIYLQVSTENVVAQAVYEKLGFETLYEYQYFEQAF